MEERFVAYNSLLKMSLLLLLGLTLCAASLWSAGVLGTPPKHGSRWFGWLSFAFFAGLCLVALQRLFDRSEWIVLDAKGIFWRGYSPAIVPWSAIASRKRISVGAAEMLKLQLKDRRQYPPKGIAIIVAFLNRLFGYGDIALHNGGTDRSFDELAAGFRRFAPPNLYRDGKAPR